MEFQLDTEQRSESEAVRKRRWLAVALLFLLTLGGTLAARLDAKTQLVPAPYPSSDLIRGVVPSALSFDGRLDRGAVHAGGDGLVHLELVATGAKLSDRAAMSCRPTDVVVLPVCSGSVS